MKKSSLKFGKYPRTTLIVATYVGNTLVCGGANGRLYTFSGSNCTGCAKVHKGAVFSIHSNGNCLITGGKDKTLRCWNNFSSLSEEPDCVIKLNHYARGLDTDGKGCILVGGRDGCIYEYGMDDG